MTLSKRAVAWGCIGWLAACAYQPIGTNQRPLAFGMTPDTSALALQVPLERVGGSRRSPVAYGMVPWDYHRQVWLQYRGDRLSGWKNSWPRPDFW